MSSASLSPSSCSTTSSCTIEEVRRSNLKAKLQQNLPALLRSLGLVVSTVEYLGAGDSYLAFAFVNATATARLPVGSFVLRSPFFEEDTFEMLTEACTLQAIQNTALPTPTFCFLDISTDNVISRPYTIGSRMPGHRVCDILEETSLSDWLSIGKSICDQLIRMNDITFRQPGELESGSRDKVGELTETLIHGQHLSGSVANWLRALIAHQVADINDGGHIHWFLFRVIRHLETSGYLTGPKAEEIVLVHGDMHGGNILAERVNGAWHVSAVLDWEMAQALPRCLATRTLEWLWSDRAEADTQLGFVWSGNLDFVPDEYFQDLPENDRALKAELDAYMTQHIPSFMEDTYGLGRWARRVAMYAIGGWHDNRHFNMLDWMMEQWERETGEKVRLESLDDEELDFEELISREEEAASTTLLGTNTADGHDSNIDPSTKEASSLSSAPSTAVEIMLGNDSQDLSKGEQERVLPPKISKSARLKQAWKRFWSRKL